MNRPFPTKQFMLYSLMLLAVYFGTNPLLMQLGYDHYSVSPEAQAFSNTIESFDAAKVKDLTKASDKPLMLHIYASWCPYCRQQNPAITDLIHQQEAKMNVVMLSIDQDKGKLAGFLEKKPQPLPYTPYIMDSGATRLFMQTMRSQRSSFDGSIPYTAFFNKEGKMVEEFSGLVDKAALDAGLKRASGQ